jgi:hypothetical protein
MESELMDFENLVKDLRRQRSRAKNARHLDTAPELAENVYPMLIGLVEAFDARMRETESQVVSLIAASETLIQPDVAMQILTTFAVATRLCDAIDKNEPTQELVAALRAAIDETSTLVDECTVAPEDEESEEASSEDSDTEASGEPEAPETPSPVKLTSVPEANAPTSEVKDV